MANLPTFTDREVYEAARSERNLFLALLALILVPLLVSFGLQGMETSIASAVLTLVRLLIGLALVYFVYDLARRIRLAFPWLYALVTLILSLVPPANVIMLLVVTSQAHKRVFQPRGIPIGFLGPKLPQNFVNAVEQEW